MVLLIVGFLMSSILIPLPSQIDQKKIVETRQYLEEIKEALLGFAVLHGRLPEPDLSGTGNGVANSSESYKEGELPWASLGVEKYDAWGNSFRYRIRAKQLNWCPGCALLKVQDAHSKPKITLIELQDDNGYSAIIFSKGKNAKGDKNNDDSDNAYSQGGYVEDPDVDKHFDDILIWLPENIVVNRLVTVGKWPPP